MTLDAPAEGQGFVGTRLCRAAPAGPGTSSWGESAAGTVWQRGPGCPFTVSRSPFYIPGGPHLGVGDGFGALITNRPRCLGPATLSQKDEAGAAPGESMERPGGPR